MRPERLSEKISRALSESDYMFSAPGLRGVSLDEIVGIVDIIRKANLKNIDRLSEEIKDYYSSNENTIQFDRDWQKNNCEDFDGLMCDCFMPHVAFEDCYCARRRRSFLETTDYRNTPEYKKWREGVFGRDKHTCKRCGQKGGELNAHHIKTFKKHPSLRYKESNGITLCAPCHRKEHGNG